MRVFTVHSYDTRHADDCHLHVKTWTILIGLPRYKNIYGTVKMAKHLKPNHYIYLRKEWFFFQALISKLLKLYIYLWWSSTLHRSPQFKYMDMYSLYSSPSAGVLRTHKVASSQLAWQLSWYSLALVSQRSRVLMPIRPEFFSGFNFTTA